MATRPALIAWWFALLAALILLGAVLPSSDRGIDDVDVTPATAGPAGGWDIRGEEGRG